VLDDATIELYKRAAKIWSSRFREDLLVGEMGELITAIMDERRGRPKSADNLIEELVDVTIVIEEIRLHMNDESKFERWRSFKLDRLRGYVDDMESKQTV
jgi:NTP pyrophosphatase (non-canonical NTP hydrolase)